MIFFFQLNPGGFKLDRFLRKPFDFFAQVDEIILVAVNVALRFKLIRFLFGYLLVFLPAFELDFFN